MASFRKYLLALLFLQTSFHLAFAETCGGILSDENGTISFKQGERYTQSESCLWMLYTPKRSVKIQLISDGFGSYDGLYVFGHDPNTSANMGENRVKHIMTIKSRNYTELTIDGVQYSENVFYVLFQTHETYSSGSGFTWRYEFVGDEASYRGLLNLTHIGLEEDEESKNGTFLYKKSPTPPFGETVHLVMQVPVNKEITMQLTNFDNNAVSGPSSISDLVVYQFYTYGNPGPRMIPLARYQKTCAGPMVNLSNYPILIHFYGPNRAVNRFNQFNLEWSIK